MNKYLETVFNIMLMRQLPQDLPYSLEWLKWVLALYVVTGIAALQMAFPFSVTLLQTLFDLSFLVATLWLVLRYLQRQARFIQVLTAIMAIGIVFQVISIPFMYALYQQEQGSTFYTVSVFVLFACLVWSGIYHWSLTSFVMHWILSKFRRLPVPCCITFP